ncbi:MAG: nuclease family protein, partial [Microvirga sp.]|nr:nuclease family protein [Microvirga sp.]
WGMKGWTASHDRRFILWFDLVLCDFYSHWQGRLVVGWPPPERSWWRRAHKNQMPVLAIHDESVLDASMPEWNEFELGWQELKALPTKWKMALAQWRGIYYIFDISDGKGYVGSAYGRTNILGRWLNYGTHGHGGNRLLRDRDPHNFRFTILQRVSPDMEVADVVSLEGSWKQRLHTKQPQGLNDN